MRRSRRRPPPAETRRRTTVTPRGTVFATHAARPVRWRPRAHPHHPRHLRKGRSGVRGSENLRLAPRARQVTGLAGVPTRPAGYPSGGGTPSYREVAPLAYLRPRSRTRSLRPRCPPCCLRRRTVRVGSASPGACGTTGTPPCAKPDPGTTSTRHTAPSAPPPPRTRALAPRRSVPVPRRSPFSGAPARVGSNNNWGLVSSHLAGVRSTVDPHVLEVQHV
jgi:hypothetical protein